MSARPHTLMVLEGFWKGQARQRLQAARERALDLSQVPEVGNFLVGYITQRQAQQAGTAAAGTPRDTYLFAAPDGAAADYVVKQFRLAGRFFQITALDTGSHCPRVGTASILAKLGVPLYLVNQHMGWVAGSTTIDVYVRGYIQPTSYDKRFFWSAMPESIQLSLQGLGV